MAPAGSSGIGGGIGGGIVAPPCRQSEITPHAAFLLLVFGYAVMDFLGPAVFENAGPDGWPLAALWSGALCGQAGFLTIWAALGPFHLWVRWLLVLLTSFGLYLLFCLGMSAFVAYVDLQEVFAEMAPGSLVIPMLFLSLQFPLWIRKTLGGWQIILASEATRHSAAEARQYGLLHILGLTTALGVALSLARAGMESQWSPSGRNGQMPVEMWLSLGIMCIAGCLYSAVWTLPSAWGCFLARDKAMGCFVVMSVWLGVCMLLVVVMVVIAAATAAPNVPGELMVALYFHVAGTAAVLMGSLHLVRMYGCVMIRTGREGKTDADTATSGRSTENGSPDADGSPQPDTAAVADVSAGQEPPSEIDVTRPEPNE